MRSVISCYNCLNQKSNSPRNNLSVLNPFMESFSCSSCLTSWRINHLSPSLHFWNRHLEWTTLIDSRGCFTSVWFFILCLKCLDLCLDFVSGGERSSRRPNSLPVQVEVKRTISLCSLIICSPCSLVVYEQNYLILIPSPPQSPSSSSSHPLASQQHPDNDWFKRWGSHFQSQRISRQELLSGQEHLYNRCYGIHWKSKTKKIKKD